jgi:hypothetical protein
MTWSGGWALVVGINVMAISSFRWGQWGLGGDERGMRGVELDCVERGWCSGGEVGEVRWVLGGGVRDIMRGTYFSCQIRVWREELEMKERDLREW